MNFKKYRRGRQQLIEEPQFVTITPRETGEILGRIDPAHPDYANFVSRIRNTLRETQFEEIVTDVLEQNMQPHAFADHLIHMFIQYFSGGADDLAELHELLLDPPTLNYATPRIFTVDAIAEPFSEFFPRAFFQDLVMWEGEGTAVTLGRGEIFLTMFTHLTNTRDAGDLMDGDVAIEVKGPDGRLGGGQAAPVKTHREAKNDLDGLFGDFMDGRYTDKEVAAEEERQWAEVRETTATIGVAYLEALHEYLIHLVIEYPSLRDNMRFWGDLCTVMTNHTNVEPERAAIDLTLQAVNREDVSLFKGVMVGLHLNAYRRHEGWGALIAFDKNYENFLPYTGDTFADDVDAIMSYFRFGGWNERQAYSITLSP